MANASVIIENKEFFKQVFVADTSICMIERMRLIMNTVSALSMPHSMELFLCFYDVHRRLWKNWLYDIFQGDACLDSNLQTHSNIDSL